jgi:hypothetical protein
MTHSYTLFNETLGESTLTDGTAAFSTTVNIGDAVHNLTDTSHGYVVTLSSGTAVITALFDGTNNYFANTSSYVIWPQKRFQLVIDPPPSVTGDTITVYYVKRPDPVYSAYRSYSLPIGYSGALVHYAAWLYKYRDREPSFGDNFYLYWDRKCKELEDGMDAGMYREMKLRNRYLKDQMKKQAELDTLNAQARQYNRRSTDRRY